MISSENGNYLSLADPGRRDSFKKPNTVSDLGGSMIIGTCLEYYC